MLVKMATEAGNRLDPDWFPPSLPQYLVFIWTAFIRLSSDRDSMGNGAIRFSAIDAYARRYGIDDIDLFDRFIALITLLDRKHLSLAQEKENNKNANH